MIQYIDFEELGRSMYSSHDRPELLVFRSAEDWSRHRALVHREPELLVDLDWSARMLVEVVLGVRGSAGFSVRVVAVERDGECLRVRAVEDSPQPGTMAAAVMTQPSVYVLTAVHHGPIALEFVEDGFR